MRKDGKSHQDAKIMTCYVHKHMLHTVDVPQTNFESRLVFEALQEAELKWTWRWIQSSSVPDKWKWITRQTKALRRLQNCKCAQKNGCVHTEMETCLVCECQQCATVLKDGAVQIKH